MKTKLLGPIRKSTQSEVDLNLRHMTQFYYF
jgi:hypothetical protein